MAENEVVAPNACLMLKFCLLIAVCLLVCMLLRLCRVQNLLQRLCRRLDICWLLRKAELPHWQRWFIYFFFFHLDRF